MNDGYRARVFIFITILFFAFSGCQSKLENEVTPSTIGVSKATNTLESIQSVIPLPSATNPVKVRTPSTIPTSSTNTEVAKVPTLVPLPTLLPTEAAIRVFELTKSNTDCQLPCWWGIEPGKTSWASTYEILAPISSEEVNIYNISGDKSFSAGFEIYVDNHKTIQEYMVYNNVVDFLEIRFNGSASYTLSDLITSYGAPEEVWISTINQDVQGAVPFDLLLGYPRKGILVYFHSMDAKVKGKQVQKCYNKENAIVLDLWDPDRKENIEQISTEAPMFPGMIAFDKFQRLEATTELDIKKFGEIFRVPNHITCLNTPTKFWKSPFE